MEVREINTPTLFCLLLCPCLPLTEHNQKQDKGRPEVVVHRSQSLGTEKEENESGVGVGGGGRKHTHTLINYIHTQTHLRCIWDKYVFDFFQKDYLFH